MADDVMALLQQLLSGGGGNQGAPDPRLAAMAQMRQQQRPQPDPSGYEGRRGAPDLPSPRDVEEMEGSGDSGLQDYVNRFGFEALDRSNRNPKTGIRNRSYVPMPRDREPHLDYNNPVGPSLIDPPLAPLRPGAQTDEFNQMRAEDAAGKGGPPSDESLLNDVQKGMTGGQQQPEDVPQDQWPDTWEGFVKMFGREPSSDGELEFYDRGQK